MAALRMTGSLEALGLRSAHALVLGLLEGDVAAIHLRNLLSPILGCLILPGIPHGLRRGLHSVAASRLAFLTSDFGRRRDAGRESGWESGYYGLRFRCRVGILRLRRDFAALRRGCAQDDRVLLGCRKKQRRLFFAQRYHRLELGGAPGWDGACQDRHDRQADTCHAHNGGIVRLQGEKEGGRPSADG